MSIQQNVNQLIGLTATAGALYQHSPAGQKAAHIKDLKAKEASLNKQSSTVWANQQENLSQDITAKLKQAGFGDAELPEAIKKHEEAVKIKTETDLFRIGQERTDLLEQMYETDPTAENYIKLKSAQQIQRGRLETYHKEGILEAIKEGQTRVQNKQMIEEFQKKVGVREDPKAPPRKAGIKYADSK